ncbi:conserved hypothetical integral membrane protein [Clostridium cavendishii DSM 21758]|uniref:Conserved hypothetical integral membrane protein n=1 Tax=Clostridium cavendishii DSM 21758 TaxID=1121302 RepID=A0A1M6SWE0_9CLOT|nr:putative sulfate exporter family transporter [Clostridium cavendishii]SHK48960.1 conserved hypothetical integral membrane protein [Clostridium cavendishii DSM 21758]
MINKVKGILPGFIVCTIIALIGMFLAKFVPSLGAATFAIFLGMLAGNTIFNKSKYNLGSKFSESNLLAYSIVLMGGTLNLSAIASVGGFGVLFIALQMTATIIFAYYVGRKLKFSKNFSLLMCSGNAVCGSSAIASTAPVVGATDSDKGIAITIVNVTGTILMFLLPLITSILYKNSLVHTSATIGGVLQSVGQVIASAKFINDDVVQMATIFKIIRIIFLVVVVIVFSKISDKDNTDSASSNKRVKVSVPWFITGFFILSIIHSLGFIPNEVSTVFKWISGNFEIIALAGIGMRVKFADLKAQGPKAMGYGLLIGAFQIIIATIFINILL